MRVLYIDHTAKIGGGEVALFNLVRYLDRSVVDPVVLLFEEGPLLERLAPVVETHMLPLAPSVGKAAKDALGFGSMMQLRVAWLSLRHVVRVARLARSLKIDLIHTNSLKADILGGLAGRLARIPVIWHVRDRIDADYLPGAVVRVFRWLSRILPRFVIANSEATLATLHLRGKRESTAIGSGVDLQARDLQAERVAASGDAEVTQGPRLGLVGRISPWKGQDVFLRAAAKVLERYPEARFELIGAALFAEREYEDGLHQLCHSLGIEPNVDFLGFVNDVPARIDRLTVLVHASTTGEPFGQVIIEGMAASKPVIATNGGGVPEIVQDGVTGLLIPMGDADAMAKAIEYLLEHPEAAAEMGRLGRRRVEEKFTIQHTARLVEAVYRRVLHP